MSNEMITAPANKFFDRGVPVVGALLVVVLIAVFPLIPRPFDALLDAPIWMYVLIGVGYMLAEHFVFHVERERDAITFSVAEVPTALALTFLSPVAAVLIRVAASVVVLGWRHRIGGQKLAFNSALFAADTVVAFGVARAFVTVDAELDGGYLLLIAGALALAQTFSLVMVSCAISWRNTGFFGRLVGDVGREMVHVPVVALTASMSLAPALVDQRLALLGVFPVAAVWMLVREHGRLTQYFRDQSDTNAFGGRIGQSLAVDDICQVAVDECARLLRASDVTLLTFGNEGGITRIVSVGAPFPDVPTDATDPAWSLVLTRDDPIAIGFAGTPPVVETAGRHYVAAPVRSEGDLTGMLLLGGRSRPADGFDAADVSRVGVLAGQLGSTLQRAHLHASMEHAALHDLLTGLPNRLAFERAVDLLPRELGDSAAVLMLDIDRFKEVNDTLGHHVGDRVLVEFSRRLSMSLGRDDVLARFGGDEFAILARRSELGAIRDLADRIINDSFGPLRLDDLDVVVTASIGVAVIERSDSSAEALRQADLAVYTAKRAHVRVEWYRPEIDRRTPDRLSMLGDLRLALANGEVDVFFQPKVDLANGVVVGAEALLRWDSGERGAVPPLDLVRVAEESGLIKQVSDYVLTASIRAASEWFANGYQLSIAVNLSTHDLLDDQLPGRIDRLLAEYGVPAGWLTLEITESALLADTPRTMTTISRLSEMGVQLSLDDFGTGYSSLGYLRRLPVNELKVDRTFVSGVLFDDQDEVIVRSTVDLGHNLGLRVVAEGVENLPMYERLRDLGCDFGQGYGISRALPMHRFLRWLSTCEYMVLTTDPSDRHPNLDR